MLPRLLLIVVGLLDPYLHYDQIQPGMTAAQVRQLMGPKWDGWYSNLDMLEETWR